MDFMSDSMIGGRKFRTLNVIDDSTREALAIEIDTSISSQRAIRTLGRIIEREGKPGAIRVDNGPEFTAFSFAVWAKENDLDIQYIQPGKTYAERIYRAV